MLIHLKNKDTLIVDDFRFKCCIGKNGLKKSKIEGDKNTIMGLPIKQIKEYLKTLNE